MSKLRSAGFRKCRSAPSRLGFGGQHDDGHIRECRFAPHATTQLGTVHAGRSEVCHDETWKDMHEFSQRYMSAFGKYSMTAVYFQCQLQRPEILGVVVDQKDG
jgi:hypothetical protein